MYLNGGKWFLKEHVVLQLPLMGLSHFETSPVTLVRWRMLKQMGTGSNESGNHILSSLEFCAKFCAPAANLLVMGKSDLKGLFKKTAKASFFFCLCVNACLHIHIVFMLTTTLFQHPLRMCLFK